MVQKGILIRGYTCHNNWTLPTKIFDFVPCKELAHGLHNMKKNV